VKTIKDMIIHMDMDTDTIITTTDMMMMNILIQMRKLIPIRMLIISTMIVTQICWRVEEMRVVTKFNLRLSKLTSSPLQHTSMKAKKVKSVHMTTSTITSMNTNTITNTITKKVKNVYKIISLNTKKVQKLHTITSTSTNTNTKRVKIVNMKKNLKRMNTHINTRMAKNALTTITKKMSMSIKRARNAITKT
jgi:hypothetical protein